MWNTYIGKKKIKNEEFKRREESSGVSGIFNMFFGINNLKNETIEKVTKKSIPCKGENIETEINVSIEEAFYGANKKISLRAIDGKIKTFSVKIPSGIRNGEKIRLIGQGKNGKNGGKNGDLFIKINIQDDKKYKLNGYDIYTDLMLSPWEAALGTKVKVNSIDEEVSVYIPKGIESGELLHIEGKGYKDGKGGRGNLIIETKIMVPKELSKQEKELFSRLNEVSKFNPRKSI